MKVNNQVRPKLMVKEELAEHLGISINTLYAWVSQKKIPYIKLGSLLRFDLMEIEKWLDEKRVDVKVF